MSLTPSAKARRGGARDLGSLLRRGRLSRAGVVIRLGTPRHARHVRGHQPPPLGGASPLTPEGHQPRRAHRLAEVSRHGKARLGASPRSRAAEKRGSAPRRGLARRKSAARRLAEVSRGGKARLGASPGSRAAEKCGSAPRRCLARRRSAARRLAEVWRGGKVRLGASPRSRAVPRSEEPSGTRLSPSAVANRPRPAVAW